MPTEINGFTVFGAIEEKWLALGGANGVLGPPLSNESETFDHRGRSQAFQSGFVSWHPDLAANGVWGLIGERWSQIRREEFGYPITDELPTPDEVGRYNHFRALHLSGTPDSSIYFHPQTGAHEVYGAIRDRWASLGWERSDLGYPVGPESPTADQVGRFQGFQGGVLVWHPETGAQIMKGLIWERWLQLGGSQFGYPIADELPTPDESGRYSHFRAVHLPGKPESSIYFHPQTGAHEVYGAIRDRWASLGWERSELGYPVGSESPTADQVGRFQGFQGGVLVWHPETGAQIMKGLIWERWQQLGGSQFGYPIADELPTPDESGRYNHFRAVHLPEKPGSSIYFHPDTGAHEVYGAIRDRWARRGWERSPLGYPVAAESDRGDAAGREQRFQHGRIVWTPESGALCDPLVFTAPIVSGGLAALGGSVSVVIGLDGSARWQGHAHNSGADGYDYGISAVVKAAGGSISGAHTGYVGGTLTAGSRDDDWDVPVRPSLVTTKNLAALNDGVFETHLEYSSDIGNTLEDLVSWAIKFAVGGLLSQLGPMLFIGIEIGSLISTGSLVPGARTAEGILWMAGPGNTLFALLAEGIADAGSRTREVRQDEYDWANAEVFEGSLPPREDLIVTDTIGPGGRKFTFPRFDGKITLNFGSDFDKPTLIGDAIFLHELVHACQLSHATELESMADALATKVCEASGTSPYDYGFAGPDFTDFNIEQQAQIVQEWHTPRPGGPRPGSNQTNVAKDPNSPYYRYIVENVWVGRY